MTRSVTYTDGSTSYAEVAHDVWTPSKQLSDELRDLLPSAHDFTGEIRRYQFDGVELMQRKLNGPRMYLVGDLERGYQREKFYVRVFFDNEVIERRDIDTIRRSCFEGARLVGQHISMRVTDMLEAMRPKGPLSPEHLQAQADWYRAPMTVRFTGAPMRLPTKWIDGVFACYDPMSDRVAIHFATYFTVAPVGEEWVPGDDA